MNKITAPLALSVLLLLTACGSNANTTASTASPTVAPTTASAPSAATAQFASIISEQAEDWREYNDGTKDCIAAGYGETVADKATVVACGYAIKTFAITSSTASRNIQALGAPPAEISDLVARTEKVLGLVKDVGVDTACAGDPLSEKCGLATISINNYASELVNILDAWKLYTN